MEEKIKIAALASYKIYPAQSGGQKGIALFYKYLSQLLPVTVISVTGNAAPDGDDIRCEALLGSSKFRYINPLLFFRLKKFIRKNKITHLILEHPYYGWLGRMLKRSCGIQLAVHSHNIESLRFKSTGRWWWRILWSYEKGTHRGADINFFITEKDLAYAIQNFRLDPDKCHLITYGTEISEIPSAEEKQAARKILEDAHGVKEDELLLLFNGFFDYLPNLNAVDCILNNINPLLLKMPGLRYKIFICGKHLPLSYQDLEAYRGQHIIYPGFVPDIKPYFKGSDIFINPVTDGGGIKTKLVEAISYNLTAVSTENGAAGIPLDTVKNKMTVVKDGDYPAFCEAVAAADTGEKTSASFFNHFFWGNIAAKAAEILRRQ